MAERGPIRATLPGEGPIVRRSEPRPTPARCVSPEGCERRPVAGARFCRRHLRQLERVRLELEGEAADGAGRNAWARRSTRGMNGPLGPKSR